MQALRDLEERKVDFEETWAIPYEAVSRDEDGMVADIEDPSCPC